MYKLEVHKGGAVAAVEHIERASDVLARIPALLEEHGDCEHIVVSHGPLRLFSVDCHGNTTPL